jgi:hypothetical protein
MDAPMPSKLQLLAIPLVLTALLLAASTAHATPVDPAAAPLAFGEEFNAEAEGDEEFEFEESECEEAEEEFDEGELIRAEVREICDEAKGRDATGSISAAPEECVLRSAHAHASLLAHDSKLKLTLGYTTYEPAGAKIEVGHGSNHLVSLQRHLGRSGVILLTRTLDDPEMAEVEAARHLTVRLQVTEAPTGCRRFEIKQLTVKHHSKHQIVWSQTD